jgi:hypothetical protein
MGSNSYKQSNNKMTVGVSVGFAVGAILGVIAVF